MKQILKRLELIKTSIIIEDHEVIESQINKLLNIDIDDDVRDILNKLLNSDYAMAILQIENYIARFSGIALYIDPEISGLKMELKALETKFQELSEEKNEYLNELNEFNIQYNLHLGELIRSIFELKQEFLYQKTLVKRKAIEIEQELYAKTNQEINKIKEYLSKLKAELDNMDILDGAYEDKIQQYKKVEKEYKNKLDELNNIKNKQKKLEEELEEDPIQQEYEETKSQYEEFDNEYEEIKTQERYELDADELIELKKSYRAASKLCHPDLVPSELKGQAIELMQNLNEAYAKKDLKKVKQILFMLENGGGFDVVSDSIDNKDVLRAKIDELKIKLREVISDIEAIKIDETFITLQNLDDWELYFEKIKIKLTKDKEWLEQQINALSSEQEEGLDLSAFSSATNKKDTYWNEKF